MPTSNWKIIFHSVFQYNFFVIDDLKNCEKKIKCEIQFPEPYAEDVDVPFCLYKKDEPWMEWYQLNFLSAL
jgi:hypothetical protein